ncbi:MAG: ribonuclease P [Candidatus Diapherotrites archaeon]
MNKREIISRIARERINRLFELAKKEFSAHPERSHRYVKIAIAIGKRCNERIPWKLKKNYCKKCQSYLQEGKNAKIRVQGSTLKITCMKCNHTRKTSLTEKKPEKTSQAQNKKQ